jgi:hypothetical protein
LVEERIAAHSVRDIVQFACVVKDNLARCELVKTIDKLLMVDTYIGINGQIPSLPDVGVPYPNYDWEGEECLEFDADERKFFCRWKRQTHA